MTFLCGVCRRYRESAVVDRTFPCCGLVFRVCEEKCKEVIGTVCRGMSAEQYTDFFQKIHEVVCQGKHHM